jgi:hypothetical protein
MRKDKRKKEESPYFTAATYLIPLSTMQVI